MRSHCLTEKVKRALLGIFLLSLYAPNNFAETFTANDIEQWLAAQTAFITWGEQHEEALAQHNTEQNDTQALDASTILEPIKAAGLYHSAEQVAKDSGFESLEAWAELSIDITKTAATSLINQQPQTLDQSTIEQLKQDTRIPEEQKQAMIEIMERNLAMSEKLRSGVTQADIDILAPYLEKIRATMSQ